MNIFCEFCFNIIRGPAVRGLGVTDPCKALSQKSCDNVPLILVLFARPWVTRAEETSSRSPSSRTGSTKGLLLKMWVLWIGIRYLFFSVTDPLPFRPLDPGSVTFFTVLRIRCLSDPWIRNKPVPDTGSKINIFEYLFTFWVKIVQFCVIYVSKKRYGNKIFFYSCFSLLILDQGSGIGKNQDPGYTSRIRNTVINFENSKD